VKALKAFYTWVDTHCIGFDELRELDRMSSTGSERTS
jgi:hypothetical protein